MELKKAVRKKGKLKMGLSGTSGSGKTYSALLLAHGITNDWNKVAVIDTENASAQLYSQLGGYATIDLQQPFSPERYIEAIRACEAGGIEVCIIDSISHEWDGKGGCLEIQEKLGGRYQDWAKVTPRHNNFIESILQSPMHVITCVRRKQDYDMTKDSSGKIKVEKAGLKEVTREGFEYELTLNMNIETNHFATASKDRTGLFMDKPSFVISQDTGKTILNWCNSGQAATTAKPASGMKDVYMAFLNNNKHLMSNGDDKLFTKNIDTWDAATYDKALDRVKGIFAKRESDLLHAEETNKLR